MGTREGKRGPCEAIPEQLSTDMDNKKLWDVAERLQCLIVSHDRAVQQMYLLGKEISKLDDLGVYLLIQKFQLAQIYCKENPNMGYQKEVCSVIRSTDFQNENWFNYTENAITCNDIL